MDDFYKSDAWQRVRDLGAAGDEAANRFRKLHTDVDEKAVQALRWCYTYDYK